MNQNARRKPKHRGVFSRLGGNERARSAEDLRNVLNDQRERNDEHVRAPINRPEAIPTVVQEELQALKRKLETIIEDKPSYIEHERRKGTPFSPRIVAAKILSKFKMQVLPNYIDKEDPVSHVNKFEIHMDIHKVSEDAQCRILPATLSDVAQEWYFKFPLASIDSWIKFVQDFYEQFYVCCIHPTKANQLVDIRQKDKETLKEYIQRLMQAVSRAKSVGGEGKMMAITAGVK